MLFSAVTPAQVLGTQLCWEVGEDGKGENG